MLRNSTKGHALMNCRPQLIVLFYRLEIKSQKGKVHSIREWFWNRI